MTKHRVLSSGINGVACLPLVVSRWIQKRWGECGWFFLAGVSAFQFPTVDWHCWLGYRKATKSVKNLFSPVPKIFFGDQAQHGAIPERKAN